ncbi:C40 family peptidase [Frondihabitans australicus]|uniref:Cell wall-associated NlpC family hydrolase n=1 Tax=Frondihabitans australicus TaxID=386892 RepID=A0A495IJ55_9MICO|nr:C40 family peptidase [Frondihabitans australicus]RKR76024.1 cell wall-associated NlpC family hydrolase [Frondihabitans australicus]
MHPNEKTSSTPVSALVDLADAPTSRPSGRRRAATPVADLSSAGALSSPVSVGAQEPASFAPSASAAHATSDAPTFDAVVSPRRAARAAREAAAAAAMSEAPASVPTSPVLPTTAVLPVVEVAPASATTVAPAAAEPVQPVAPVAPAAASVAAPVSPAAELAPTPFTGSLAVGIPAPESSSGRRETFVPSAAGAGRGSARPASRSTVARRRPAALAAPAAQARPPRRGAFSRVGVRVAVAAVIAGILATSILPAIGHTGAAKAYASTNADGSTTVHIGNQTYDVAAGVDSQVLARDGYSATSVLDYETQVIANRKAEKVTTYTGPTAAEYVAHPLYSDNPLDRSQVFNVALQYLGTPYVHGGADPSAFDCSGFIMFVYAQFGISLPHYVPSQDALGTTIPQSEAVPGDLVVFDNEEHDGFYAGNGMILDAPKPGGVVSVRPIWDQPHHFVRINP